MPHRTLNVMLGVLGILAIAALVVAGANLRRHSQTGPRWKRKLVAAGLVLLTILGASPRQSQADDKAKPVDRDFICGNDESLQLPTFPVLMILILQNEVTTLEKMCSSGLIDRQVFKKTLTSANLCISALSNKANLKSLTDAERAEVKRLLPIARKQIAAAEALLPIGTNDLTKSPQWKIVVETWKAAGPLAETGKSTTAQRKDIYVKFAEAKKAVNTLVAAGLLTDAEAKLLAADADRLNTEIRRIAPTDYRGTCYMVGRLPEAYSALGRLDVRLPLLKKIDAAEIVKPAVLDKVMAGIEKDLATLSDEAKLKRIDGEKKKDAIKTRNETASLIVQLKRKVLAARLKNTAGWEKVENAFTTAAPLSESGQSTMAQRTRVRADLKAATDAIDALVELNLLTVGEASLLRDELALLKQRVYRNPPTDMAVKCYEIMAIQPAKQSMDRLGKRLGLLEKLVESGRLNPAVLRKILPTVRADIKTLTDKKELGRLNEDARKQAIETRTKAEALLVRIEKKIAMPAESDGEDE